MGSSAAFFLQPPTSTSIATPNTANINFFIVVLLSCIDVILSYPAPLDKKVIADRTMARHLGCFEGIIQLCPYCVPGTDHVE
jgi:hypothetical protein